MCETKHSDHQQPIAKLKHLSESKTALLTTLPVYIQLIAPMFTQCIDDNGSLWFLERLTSAKNKELTGNQSNALMYVNADSDSYLFDKVRQLS